MSSQHTPEVNSEHIEDGWRVLLSVLPVRDRRRGITYSVNTILITWYDIIILDMNMYDRFFCPELVP